MSSTSDNEKVRNSRLGFIRSTHLDTLNRVLLSKGRLVIGWDTKWPVRHKLCSVKLLLSNPDQRIACWIGL